MIEDEVARMRRIKMHGDRAHQQKMVEVRQKNNPDFFFPPFGGREPSAEAVHRSTQRYIEQEKRGELTYKGSWGGWKEKK